jgi:hypothetical protein
MLEKQGDELKDEQVNVTWGDKQLGLTTPTLNNYILLDK